MKTFPVSLPKLKQKLFFFHGGLALAFASQFMASDARANVYATNIKLNGNLTNSVSVGQGSPVQITYILNEAATAGVT
ncbi:MAG: hypothetical protein M3Y82_01560, partial [Verrucomicrobiota bacterium]|nr:hypothetical protein [Verrucomicrobiota bacterium]